VSEDTITNSNVLKDISELRREVEQLRSEVRRKDENLQHSDNKEVILDWLKESVGDLKEEVRNLEIKEASEVIGVKEEDLERVRREVSIVKKDMLQMRVEEERSFSSMEEIKQKLDHVTKGEEMALRTIMDLKSSGIIPGHAKRRSDKNIYKHKSHKSLKKPHKNLSKKHLQMWMTSTDNMHEELFNLLEHTQNKLNKMEKKHSVSCSKLEKRMGTVAKAAEEQSEVQERKEEADGIMFASMTNKLDQVDLTLQKIQHQQTKLQQRIDSVSEDLLIALKNLQKTA